MPPDRTTWAPSALRQTMAALGAAGFMVVCCLVMPTLLAAGVLAAIGGWLRQPVVLLLAIAVAALALKRLGRRRASCDPPAGSGVEGE